MRESEDMTDKEAVNYLSAWLKPEDPWLTTSIRLTRRWSQKHQRDEFRVGAGPWRTSLRCAILAAQQRRENGDA